MRRIKWFFQRIFRGYSDYDMLDYGEFACRKLLPSLKHWVAMERNGYPESVGSKEEWDKILQEIVWAVEETAYGKEEQKYFDVEEPIFHGVRKVWERQEKGLELFGKYLGAMWE